MADNFAKLWIQKTSNQLAVRRARQVIRNTGRALPCRVTRVDGSIVTVAFELDTSPYTLPQITIPKAKSNWIRVPTQVGDKGLTVPADAYLGGVSGLGGGIAGWYQPGNLSSLVFLPTSNKNSPPIDGNAAQIQGPNGVIIRNTQGEETRETLDQNGYRVERGSNSIAMDSSSITLTVGGKVVKLDSSGLTIDGILFDTHTHLYNPGPGTPTPTEGPE